MDILRKILVVTSGLLVLLSLSVMLIQGVQTLQSAFVVVWLSILAALSGIGGKPLRLLGYLASAVIVVVSVVLMKITFTLEPGSHDAFGGLIVSIAGILMGGGTAISLGLMSQGVMRRKRAKIYQ